MLNAILNLALLMQAPAAAPPTQKLPSVTGVVLNANTKEPLRKAEVVLQRMGGRAMGGGTSMSGGAPGGANNAARRVTTNAEGRFEFTAVEPGSYGIHLRRGGFLDTRYGARTRFASGAILTVSAAQDVTGLRVEMMPQAIVAGRVVDEDGEPVQNVHVQLFSAVRSVPAAGGGGRGGRGNLMPVGGGQTDDRGQFRIINVPPGKAVLQVTPHRWGGGPNPSVNESQPGLGYAPVYYPGVSDPGQAEKIDVTAGAEMTGFQIRLQLTSVVRVRGKVIGPDGEPPRGFMVNLMPRDMPFIGPAVQQFSRTPDGGFELANVVPGSYSLMVNADMGGDGSAGGGGRRFGSVHREPLDVGSQNIENLTVRMLPPFAVTGQVVLPKNATVDLTRVHVNLVDSSGGGPFMPMGNSQVKDDGTFLLERVVPGKYRAMVNVPVDSAYVESVRLGDFEVNGQEFDLTAAGAPLRVLLGVDGGKISGNVTADGAQAAGANVVLVPAKGGRAAFQLRFSSTDQNGVFALNNIAPGEYLLFAFDEAPMGSFDDDDEFRRIESKGKRLSIAKSGTETVSISLTRAGN